MLTYDKCIHQVSIMANGYWKNNVNDIIEFIQYQENEIQRLKKQLEDRK